MSKSVSVLLFHHLPSNRPYLDLALKAVLASEGIDFNVHLICDYEIKDVNVPWNDEKLSIWTNPELNTATKKANWGAKHTKGDFILLLSDDVVLNKYALKNMVDGCGENAVIVNPMSNQENGSRYLVDLSLSDEEGRTLQLKHNMSIEEVRGFERSIIESKPLPPIQIPVPWVSFYCTMIPRKVWELVGELDEAMDVQFNDCDYCYRAKNLGVHTLINLSAFCLHFGSKTLSQVVTDQQKRAASYAFMAKYGSPSS